MVCNVEMGPDALLDRQLARLSGVDATIVQKRLFKPQHTHAIARGMGTLEAVIDQVCVVLAPSDLDNVAATADRFGADILTADPQEAKKPFADHVAEYPG